MSASSPLHGALTRPCWSFRYRRTHAPSVHRQAMPSVASARRQRKSSAIIALLGGMCGLRLPAFCRLEPTRRVVGEIQAYRPFSVLPRIELIPTLSSVHQTGGSPSGETAGRDVEETGRARLPRNRLGPDGEAVRKVVPQPPLSGGPSRRLLDRDASPHSLAFPLAGPYNGDRTALGYGSPLRLRVRRTKVARVTRLSA